MPIDVRDVISAIEQWQGSQTETEDAPDTEETTDSFDTDVAPLVQQFADQVLGNPSTEAIKDWLTIQAMLVNLEEDSFSEVTQQLNDEHPDEVSDAIAGLSQEQRDAIKDLIEDFEQAGEPGTEEDAEAADDAEPAALAAPTAPPAGVRGVFTGKRVFRSTRGFPVVQGIFTLFGSAGTAIGRYTVNSGGGASSFRRQNGPVPPGTYRVSNFRVRTKDGMVFNGVGYSFNLDPVAGTPVFGRSLFRIHPDGRSPGTNGCLGVRENAAQLRQCRDQLRDLMRASGGLRVLVDYSGLPIT